MKKVMLFVSVIQYYPVFWRSYVFATTVGPNPGSTFASDNSNGSAYAVTNPGYAAVQGDGFRTRTIPSGDVSQYLKVTGFGFTIPLGNQIDGITVSYVRKCGPKGVDASDPFESEVMLVKNGTIQGSNNASGSWPGTEATSTKGNSTDKWGPTWTVDDVNASDFGIAISISEIFGPCGTCMTDARVDYVSITIDYSPIPAPLGAIALIAHPEKSPVSGIPAVILDWSSETLNKIDQFEIQRSENGTDFIMISDIDSGRQTDGKFIYTDNNPLPNTSFYRIKGTTKDGNFLLSNTSEVFIEKPPEFSVLSIYPNPARDFFALSIFSPSPDQEIRLDIFSISGEKVMSRGIPSLSQGFHSLSFPVSGLKEGIYLVSLKYGRAEKHMKINIEH